MVPLRTPPRRVNPAAGTLDWSRLFQELRLPGLPLERRDLLDELLPVFAPCVEVRDGRDCYLILADLPGLVLEDVDVRVSQDLLTISGERERDPLGDDEFLLARDRPFGSFHCAFPIPQGLDRDGATATLENGVLAVKLPKPPREPPRRVPVTLGAPCGCPRATPPPAARPRPS